jgi:hypothetical protein
LRVESRRRRRWCRSPAHFDHRRMIIKSHNNWSELQIVRRIRICNICIYKARAKITR